MHSLYKRYKVILIVISMYVLFTVAGKLTTYYWFKDMDDYHVIPGSYNRALSDSLQKVLFRTRIKISEVKAMVYDSVQGSRYHYIECRLKLEENYLTDDDTEKEMRRIILTKIFEMFPPDLYTGKIKVEYKGFLHSKVAMFPVDSNQLKYNF